jgi:hypothetical protein
MRIKLDGSIYRWLMKIKVLKLSSKPRMKPNGIIELDEHTTRHFENGTVFGLILQKLSKLQNYYAEKD